MPKENTHLYFADKVYKSLQNNEIGELIQARRDQYYLGCVLPDSFFYAKDKAVISAGHNIHGKHGNLTNEIVLDMLQQARQNQSKEELSFVAGYITHCVLDMVFHPVIIYLVGINSDSSPKGREADYRHRQWETYLDSLINKEFNFSGCINMKILPRISFWDILSKSHKLPKNTLIKSAKRQWRINKMLYSKAVYLWAALLSKLKMIGKEDLAIFYPHINKSEQYIPERIKYRDVISGEAHCADIENLFTQARRLAKQRIQASYDYYLGKIDKKEAEKIILGESLETGKVGCSIDEIHYTLEK